MRMASYATDPGIGSVNEDYVVCGPDWAAVFDGATAPVGVDSGCIHDVAWLVARLASAVTARMPGPLPLDDLLAEAITDVRELHASTCNLANPDSPSSTVALCRIRGTRLDYLVLADSPILLWHPTDGTRVFADNRLAELPGDLPYTAELMRSHRNRPGGFWVASTVPEAAYKAVKGSAELKPGSEIALLTDGATRLGDYYGHSWDSLFNELRRLGPEGLIALVRTLENRQPVHDDKLHDDATVAYLR